MLERIDSWLLEKTEKVVKRWNWLTGKDNFDLARLVNLFGLIGFVSLTALALFIKTTILISILCSAINLYGGTEWHRRRLLDINTWKDIKENEALEGIKHFDNNEMLRARRIGSIAGSIICLLFISIVGALFKMGNLWVGGFAIEGLANIAVYYLMSVEKPPHSKSQVKDWLKSRLSALAPTLEPAQETA